MSPGFLSSLNGLDTASVRGAPGPVVDPAADPPRALRRPTLSVIEFLHGYVILKIPAHTMLAR
jgi:hypothetical protein